MPTLDELRANEKIWAHLLLCFICPFGRVISVSKLRCITPAYIVVGAAAFAIIGAPAQFSSVQERPSSTGLAIRTLIPLSIGGLHGSTLILTTRESESDSFANATKYAVAGSILGSTFAVGSISESRWKLKSTK